MAPPRSMQDPFTEAPVRTTTGNPALHSQTSQHSLRSNTSTASSRARQPRDLFAPTLSRRPTSRATPNVRGEVLADSDPERELPSQQYGLRHRQRRASPNDRGECEKHKKDEEVDAFNRGPDGNYLTPISQLIETPLQQLMGSGEMVVEKRQNAIDASFVEAGRHHLTSKTPSGSRIRDTRRREEDDEMESDMKARLREMAMHKLDEDRWRFEPVDPHGPTL